MANVMTDYDYLRWCLNKHYITEGVLEENQIDPDKKKAGKPQRVSIVSDSRVVSDYTVYRFDTKEKGDHLNFFNKDDGAPQNLNAFCDYIILAQNKQRKAYVVLVEMKRGKSSHAEEQLNAGRSFLDYVLQSCTRVRNSNGMADFDHRKVEFRRVILKPSASNKWVTKPKETKYGNKRQTMTILANGQLRLHDVL